METSTTPADIIIITRSHPVGIWNLAGFFHFLCCNLPNHVYNAGMSSKKLVTINEAATIVSRDRSQISRYIKHGLLYAEKLGSQWVIRRTDLRKFRLPTLGRPPA